MLFYKLLNMFVFFYCEIKHFTAQVKQLLHFTYLQFDML